MSDKDKLKEIKEKRIEELKVREEDIDALARLLDSEYRITIKSICKDFKASRTWVNDYIRYNLHYIKILNKRGVYNNAYKQNREAKSYNKEGREFSVPFVTFLELCYGLKLKDCLYFSEEEYLEYVGKHIREITRQTISLPFYSLFTKKEYDRIISNFKNSGTYTTYLDFKKNISKYTSYEIYIREREFTTTYKKYLVNSLSKTSKKIFDKSLTANYNRDSIERVNISLKEALRMREGLDSNIGFFRREELPEKELVNTLLKKMYTIRDIKDYGDSEEVIYRDLFRRGTIKITFSFKTLEGKALDKKYSKVYYLDAPKTYVEYKYPDYLSPYYLDFTLAYRDYLDNSILEKNLETYFI